jgi:hypothetical protein
VPVRHEPVVGEAQHLPADEAAPAWRLELLAELIADAGCGLVADRGMLGIYAPSIIQIHALGERIIAERERFRRKPDHWRTPSDWRRRRDNQLQLPLDPR